jgi:antitoxin (DNA-binding transcriptional repressor) of toxin-antitoxin stability system
MERLNVTQAARNLCGLLNRGYSQGTSIELERDGEVIACLVPVQPTASLRAKVLQAFFAALPRLGQDAEAFAEDIKAAKAFRIEKEEG